MVSDPIADMLTRMRNAAMARKPDVLVPNSKVHLEIARVLKEEGYIGAYEVQPWRTGAGEMIRIGFKQTSESRTAFTGLKRVSRPSVRAYTGSDDIPRVMDGMGVVIMSTSRGVMSGQQARRLGIGGEVLCLVW